MNPRTEDFERLVLRWADAMLGEDGDYAKLASALASFPELYAANRDALPQNDADRAFGLVVRACDLLDRSVIMAETDEEAAQLTQEAAGYIDEALKLDPACHDAVRIRRYLDRPTRDEMVSFLSEKADAVREDCVRVARENGSMPDDGFWSRSPYLRPYLRWLFDLANEQLSCGRYRAALQVSQDLAALDDDDLVGARHVAAYTYVKLEDAEGLERLIGPAPGAQDAWFMLARCFMAYKRRRLDEAADALHRIVRAFPNAGATLTYQEELPPGVFGHLEYMDGSPDELYIAVSEAAVVLDENCGDYSSPLSDWIANDPVVAEALAAEEARQEVAEAERARRNPPIAPQGR
jgi:tetratricopeptide (TPR) repeat protein